MQVLFLGRAPRTKETLPDFLKWRRVIRPPLVFRGLTGSQRTPGIWGVTCLILYFFSYYFRFQTEQCFISLRCILKGKAKKEKKMYSLCRMYFVR